MDIGFNSDIESTHPAHAFYSSSSLPHLEAGPVRIHPRVLSTSTIRRMAFHSLQSLSLKSRNSVVNMTKQMKVTLWASVSVPPQGYTQGGLVDRPTHENQLRVTITFRLLIWVPRNPFIITTVLMMGMHPLRNPVFDANSFSVGTGNTSCNMRRIPSPPISSSSSSRDRNQVFVYTSEMASSQVTIEDYSERFGIVLPALPSHSFTHGHEYDYITPHPDPLGEVYALQAHTQENYCYPGFSPLNQPQCLSALPNRRQSPYRTARLTGIQDTYISSYSSLAGWNGDSNSTVATSASISTNLASLPNPGGTVPAAAFTTPGRSLRSSSANPQILNTSPEPSAGGDGLPSQDTGAPEIGGSAGIHPLRLLSYLPMVQHQHFPRPSKPYPPLAAYLHLRGKSLAHMGLNTSPRCHLAAIRTHRLKLQDGWIINTSEKWEKRKKYISDFCPSCHKTFPGPREVRNHVMSTPECSKSSSANIAPQERGIGRAKEIGYSHPGDPDLQNIAAREVVEGAVEQDLEKREYN
ncbi:hypothetical protein BU17DRAFT_62171 [Hysterangium stoloniferum]|nr:hypothetical protein BU17DRAFT_62171 [Hysterangium stoloniferum]